MTTDAPFNVSASTPEQCQLHLDGLLADKDFSSKLAGRDPETFAQFHRLSHRISGVPETAASESPIKPYARDTASSYGEPTFAAGEQAEMIEAARNLGYSDASISEWFGDWSSSPELVEAAKVKWAELESDPQFRQALVKGEPAARRKLRAYSTIMSHATA